MHERYSHFLAADTEAEMEEWVSTLKQALQGSSEASQDRRNGAEALDGSLGESCSVALQPALAIIACSQHITYNELGVPEVLGKHSGP